MARPDLDATPAFYHKYILLAEGNAVKELLASQQEILHKFWHSIPMEKYDFAYGEGKWTLKQLLLHITDTERIFGYRALCIARGESQSLPGFDENTYAAASFANERTWNDVVEEFFAVRQSIHLLFRSFNEEQLEREGISNGKPITVNAIGFILAGHMQHHMNIIEERYL